MWLLLLNVLQITVRMSVCCVGLVWFGLVLWFAWRAWLSCTAFSKLDLFLDSTMTQKYIHNECAWYVDNEMLSFGQLWNKTCSRPKLILQMLCMCFYFFFPNFSTTWMNRLYNSKKYEFKFCAFCRSKRSFCVRQYTLALVWIFQRRWHRPQHICM